MTKGELERRVVAAFADDKELHIEGAARAAIRVVLEAAAEMADAERDEYSHAPLMACSVATTAARIRRAITAAPDEDL